MFKKPLGNLKTVSPLSGSDRRKLKQARHCNISVYLLKTCDQLIPERIQSVKFSTHVKEPGVAYLAPDGDPLWFTVGKGSVELVPTIYTLWKKRDLLPIVCTPPSVIPFLIGGADLMIPGVIHRSPSIDQGQLVSICQLDRKAERPTLSPPLGVGRMAIPGDQMTEDAKGKAVFILQTWNDHLWEMGSNGDVPESTVWGGPQEEDEKREEAKDQSEERRAPGVSTLTKPPGECEQPPIKSPTSCKNLSFKPFLPSSQSLPPSSFPISSTQFYTNYILPFRPAYPASVLLPSSAPPDLTKEQKHSQQADLLVTSVNASHPNVAGHTKHVTVKAVEEKAARKVKKEEGEKNEVNDISVRELWKPHLETVPLFKGIGGGPEALYTMQEIRSLLNSYIASKNLVNPNVQAYINLDPLLSEFINAEGQQKKKRNSMLEEPNLLKEYMKREELLKKDWYEITREGGEVSQKKGSLKPISVVVKVRQGRKTSTLITGFEPFLTADAETIADELRKVCASATSVSPLPGKQAGTQILVHGKQSKATFDYFTSSGVPKRWVEIQDEAGGKR
ncbi:eukaryotic translation initiation factor SUI1 family protein [Amanita rubescens]|nr:eukaryotic translation initiation factor SUI1 family protein [Amanita rubescens]